LDEGSFTRLLAAAYVMQEHQLRVRAAISSPAPATSQIVESQHQQERIEELESERANVLATLQKLQPELEKLAQESFEKAQDPAELSGELCRACGHEFVSDETYCGKCGASRASGQYPGAELQSKWATLWERHLSGVADGSIPVFRKPPPKEPVPYADKLPFDVEAEILEDDSAAEYAAESTDIEIYGHDDASKVDAVMETEIEASPWTSAAQAKRWLEARSRQTWWTRLCQEALGRPGDVSLGMAALILALTLGWALWPQSNTSLASAQPMPASVVKRRARPQGPKLTLMEKALVAVGLAIPPPTPQYTGDPDVKVWEDPQNGLYYCADADLYGTTPKGRYATQGDAQLDSFEPASRHYCN
jgi:hypothetical protein